MKTEINRPLSEVEWVRPPRQTRSQETLERILDAAESVVTEKGFEGATVSEIVRRAKSSVGAFYARFPDKDALLAGLYERFFEEAIATADVALEPQRWADASIQEILAEVVPFLVQIYEEKEGLVRAFIICGGCDEAFLERGEQLFSYVSAGLAQLLLDRRAVINHPNPELAIEFGLGMVFDVLDEATLRGGRCRRNIELNNQALADELTRMYLSYLGVESENNGFNTFP